MSKLLIETKLLVDSMRRDRTGRGPMNPKLIETKLLVDSMRTGSIRSAVTRYETGRMGPILGPAQSDEHLSELKEIAVRCLTNRVQLSALLDSVQSDYRTKGKLDQYRGALAFVRDSMADIKKTESRFLEILGQLEAFADR